jgi:hypothetical protein
MEQGEFDALSENDILLWIAGTKGAQKIALEKRLGIAYQRFAQMDWDADNEFKKVIKKIKDDTRKTKK